MRFPCGGYSGYVILPKCSMFWEVSSRRLPQRGLAPDGCTLLPGEEKRLAKVMVSFNGVIQEIEHSHGFV